MDLMRERYDQYTESIRAIAKRLLAGGAVERVIGFEESGRPLRATPLIARTPDEADRLVWHGGCREDLALFLRGKKGRSAIVAKGCDSRALIALIQEQQIKRSDVHIIGVACPGVLYLQELERRLDFEEMMAGEERGDTVVIRSAVKQGEVDRAEALYYFERVCKRDPSFRDVQRRLAALKSRGSPH